MKQLLHRFQAGNDIFWVSGLKDRAFLGSSASDGVVEFLESEPSATTTNDPQREALSNEIQAVAGCAVQDGEENKLSLYVAVARANKALAIYRISEEDLTTSQRDDESKQQQSPTTTEAFTVHKTPKRVSSLCFAKVPADTNSESSKPLTVLIAGDLVGDVAAYSLTEATTQTTAKESEQESASPYRRLLLGHTASMLTAVEMSRDQALLFSADRDEKIRISSFPFTARIHGFLLGHLAFVSSMALCGEQWCVSTGGDGLLHVWDTLSCQTLGSHKFQSNNSDEEDDRLIPVKVAVHGHKPKSNQFCVTVIYERSKWLDTLSVTINEGYTKGAEIVHSQRRELQSQPLAVVPWKESQVAVLVRDSDYLLAFSTTTNSDEPAVMVSLPRDMRTDDLPDSLLEKDKDGSIAMLKNTETRGPAQQMPWNDAKRKETARTRNRRYRKKRRGDNEDTTAEASS